MWEVGCVPTPSSADTPTELAREGGEFLAEQLAPDRWLILHPSREDPHFALAAGINLARLAMEVDPGLLQRIRQAPRGLWLEAPGGGRALHRVVGSAVGVALRDRTGGSVGLLYADCLVRTRVFRAEQFKELLLFAGEYEKRLEQVGPLARSSILVTPDQLLLEAAP